MIHAIKRETGVHHRSHRFQLRRNGRKHLASGGDEWRIFWSYDLNGSTPAHSQMELHLRSSEWGWARLLKTVWYVGAVATEQEVISFVEQMLGQTDSLLVVRCDRAVWRNLLVEDASLQQYWASY